MCHSKMNDYTVHVFGFSYVSADVLHMLKWMMLDWDRRHTVYFVFYSIFEFYERYVLPNDIFKFNFWF